MNYLGQIEELEKLRKSLSIRIISMLAIFFLPMISSWIAPSTMLLPILMIVMIGYFVYTLFTFPKIQKEFKRKYKELFVNDILTAYFSNVQYMWEKGFSKEEVRNMGLSQMGNRFSSEDYLFAEYKGVRFEQADVRIKNETGSGKNRHTVTYFSGRMFVFENTLKRVSNISIYSSQFSHRASTWGSEMRNVEFEDVDFNRQFDVKSLDEHDAFYLITPNLMEKLKALKAKYGNVAMHFYNDKICVGYNTLRDSFDASITRPITYEDECARVESDIRDIIDIIEIMGMER